ncbi:hypothetical protein [Flexithrix dorotheae]|uniref:hypothetical protein n=1 Tax=Flexithrix dorotheae TaxID=70993 RepID=UPI000360A804|nr:hypothetical protein [Flexithrix dorotheae]
MKNQNRRKFLKNTFITGTGITIISGFSSFAAQSSLSEDNYPSVRAITNSPNHHWFGYYDKWQTDPTGRYVLGMEVDFESRPPKKDDKLIIGMVDMEDNDKWISFGETTAWGWQQGCMLQWRPGSDSEVIWNSRKGEKFVSIIYDIKTKKQKVFPRAVYALDPQGKFAVCSDFARIDNMRVGYGYVGGKDQYYDQEAPKESGIHRMDLDTGKAELIVTLNQISKIPHNGVNIEKKWHYFNHLLVGPTGDRMIFLNRYRDFPLTPEMRADPLCNVKFVRGKYVTRMFTVNCDGTDLYELDKSGKTSHFIWRDPEHVLAWTKYKDKNGFYLFKDKTEEVSWVGKGDMTQNGHQTYIPNTNNEWLLNDTYPQGNERLQTLYLYHIPTGKTVILGKFHSPKAYQDEWRCDLHPRYTPDGKKVIFDSTHGGNGRQMYMIDISQIVNT